MIEKKVEVCIGTSRSGEIRARLSLMLVDGNSVISEQYHSMALMPGDNPVEARKALEAHLEKPQAQGGIPGAPWPKIPDSEWAKVVGAVQLFHSKNAG